MGLTLVQKSIVSKARAVGGGKQGVALSDQACAFLVAVIARDLRMQRKFPEFPKQLPEFLRGTNTKRDCVGTGSR